MDNTNFNYYKHFYYVVKNQSYTKAASELNISQPNLSSSISKLERDLKVKLLDRSGKVFKLTEEGEKIFSIIENLYEEFHEFNSLIDKKNKMEYGQINIGTRSHIAKFFLLNFIKKFNEKYPKIRFNVICKRTDKLLKMLDSKKLDIVLDDINMCEFSNIKIKKVITLNSIFVTPDEYNNIKEIKDLERYDLLFPDTDSFHVKKLLEYTSRKGINLVPLITSNSTEIIINCLKMNLGVAFVFREIIQKYLSTNKLYEITLEDELPKMDISVAYNKHNINITTKTMLDMIFNYLNEFEE